MSLVGKSYNEPGSWGRLSEGWPETPYTPGKWLLCTKADVVPYGSYVCIQPNYPSDAGAVIRVASEELKKRLDEAYREMFIICRTHIVEELVGASSQDSKAATFISRLLTMMQDFRFGDIREVG